MRLAGQVSECSDFVAQNPRDGAYGRDIVLVADSITQQLVSDFPSENSRIFLLEFADIIDNFGGGDPGFGTTDSSR